MKKGMLFTIVLVMLFAYINITVNGAEFPDMENHWAAESVTVLTGNNIIAGWGGLFHPEDHVKANEYIKMVVTALGYTDIQNYPGDWARDYVGKAMELGLVVNGEIANYNEPINRGMMAKIAMRALRDEKTPDYITAYKGLVSDYEDLEANIRLDALKCIEKGIIKGMPDGSFKPGYYSTRAEAATVIHRMISQEERENAKPVFATPDPEFEAFMASPEAENVCSVRNIYKVVDGKIIYGGLYSEYQEDYRLLQVYHNRDANKEAYEILRNLVMFAKDNGHYVRSFLNSDSNRVYVRYYEEPKYGLGPNWDTTYNLGVVVSLDPFKYSDEQEQYTFYTWHIANLAMQTSVDWAAINYREPEMTKAVEIALKSIYGDDLGQSFFEFSIGEYDMEREFWFRQGKKQYSNFFLEYREDLGGLEINNNNYSVNSKLIQFSTNRK